jgi:RNA polymerase sigma factor (sigma-70 family)
MRDPSAVIRDEHLVMVKQIVHTVRKQCPPYIEYDDLYSQGLLGLSQAAHRFDPSRTEAFGAFARKRARGAMWDFVRQEITATKRGFSRSAQLDSDRIAARGEDVEQRMIENAELRTVLALASGLPLKQRTAISALLEGFSFQQIGRRLGLSARQASNTVARARLSLGQTVSR